MHVVRGAVSPDGLSWTLLEEPLLDVGKTLLDTQNIAAYDEDTGQYLAFLRGNVERRRSRGAPVNQSSAIGMTPASY